MPNTKTFFNNAAKIWDKKSRRPQEENVKTMLRLSDIRAGLNIIDAGCGTGFLEPYLLKTRPNNILAVDFAENMIAQAERKITDPRVFFRSADLFDIVPEEFPCDICIFYDSFPHFEDQPRLVGHLARIVKPGGRLTISHTQGKKTLDSGILLPALPAQGLINLLGPCFRLDVLIDNNVFFMVSGINLGR